MRLLDLFDSVCQFIDEVVGYLAVAELMQLLLDILV
jgi:hypothetical protein